MSKKFLTNFIVNTALFLCTIPCFASHVLWHFPLEKNTSSAGKVFLVENTPAGFLEKKPELVLFIHRYTHWGIEENHIFFDKFKSSLRNLNTPSDLENISFFNRGFPAHFIPNTSEVSYIAQNKDYLFQIVLKAPPSEIRRISEISDSTHLTFSIFPIVDGDPVLAEESTYFSMIQRASNHDNPLVNHYSKNFKESTALAAIHNLNRCIDSLTSARSVK